MKLYFFIIECTNQSLLCRRKRIKINKLFVVTSCFSKWEFMSSWLTWKYGQEKGMSFTCFINYTLQKSSMLQGTYFILVKFMLGKYRKAVFFILSTVFGWTHFAKVCCMYVLS